MRNILLIARREFIERGRTGAYIATTLFMMFTLVATTVLPAYLDRNEKQTPMKVVLLDRTGQLAAPLQAALGAVKAANPSAPEVTLQVETGDEAPFVEKARKGDTAVLVVEGTYPGALTARFLTGSFGVFNNAGAVLGPLENLVRGARLQERGIDPKVAGEILRPLTLDTKHLTGESGERDRSRMQESLLTVMGFVMLIYLALLMNSQFVFQGVLEEKVSRVIEVMASTVTSAEMLAGKILGLGVLGLVQFAALGVSWAAGSALASGFSSTAAEPPSVKVIVLALVYLVLGFLLFASLMAGAAATVSRMEDGQTLMMPMIMIIALPMFFLGMVLSNPNSNSVAILSLIPFFTPIVMLVRVMMGSVPAWQLGLSVVLMIITAYACTRIGARVYRAAMLVHGSRPSMKQLWQYLRAG